MDGMNPFGGGPDLRAMLAAMIQQMMQQQADGGGYDQNTGPNSGMIGMQGPGVGYQPPSSAPLMRRDMSGGNFQFDPSRPQMQPQQDMQGGGGALGSLGLAARLIAAAMGGGGGFDQSTGPNSGMLGLGRQMTDIQPRNSAPLQRRPMGQGFQFDPARPAMLGSARDRNVR